jgi:secondary thiamine-phosphate synthase enzyme
MREGTITISTTAREQIAIVTPEVQSALEALTDGDGICTIVTPHTTCAVSVNENADPAVPTDVLRALRAMIPGVRFDHAEGNSDAHLLSTIIGCSVSVPYRRGKLVLGTWQGIYFIELDGPRRRQIRLYVLE